MTTKKPAYKKPRKKRISFCEWNSASMGNYNTGGVICENCNFSHSLARGESRGGSYDINNKIGLDSQCARCGSSTDWYWLPPIARVPKRSASKRVWKLFWVKLKNRDFNHGATCR